MLEHPKLLQCEDKHVVSKEHMKTLGHSQWYAQNQDIFSLITINVPLADENQDLASLRGKGFLFDFQMLRLLWWPSCKLWKKGSVVCSCCVDQDTAQLFIFMFLVSIKLWLHHDLSDLAFLAQKILSTALKSSKLPTNPIQFFKFCTFKIECYFYLKGICHYIYLHSEKFYLKKKKHKHAVGSVV